MESSMSDLLTRRSFLVAVPVLCAAPTLLGAGRAAAAAAPQTDAYPAGGDAFPAQDPARVRAIVGASHGNLARVQELLTESPALANAGWDWGFGDWETPIGAASHVGNREIAALLLDHGARPDLFTFAMLGHLEAVQACVAASPGIQRTTGPHGLTLLHHARKGGPAAQGVVAYLESLGDADPVPVPVPLEPADLTACTGIYEMERRGGGRLEISAKEGTLFFKRLPDGAPRGLVHLGSRDFHPVGARAVRITFTPAGPVAANLRVVDGPEMISALRLPG
jgi:hypothetical protein